MHCSLWPAVSPMSYIIWVKELGILITINKCNIYVFIYLFNDLLAYGGAKCDCISWTKLQFFTIIISEPRWFSFFFSSFLYDHEKLTNNDQNTLHSFIHILFNFGAVFTWKVYIFKMISSKIQTHHICNNASQSFFFPPKLMPSLEIHI